MHGSAEILILFYDLWSKTIISFISYQSGLVPEDFTTDNEGWGGIIPVLQRKRRKNRFLTRNVIFCTLRIVHKE